jgi:D-alanyl-lipoteichoic acid acyltransferase DltB (MBOAT superfamily)
VILPVGISFYTFHGLSYVIDVYNGRINAERNIVDYCLFVSFFPLLVAGPIERATHLLPQLKKERPFNHNQAVDGLKQILWGLFKKIVIADQCAAYANMIFNDATSYSGSTLIVGALFFAIQIYGDFSGYSDIALGTAKLFGIELLRNFAYPYFSRDIAEFWRRWHISLSSWFRDYLYIPLGGSKGNKATIIRNTLIIFLVSGFWHGANWTFIIWGLLHAIYMLPSVILRKNRTNLEIVAKDRSIPSVKEAAQITFTFCLTVFAWIFFRASDLSHAFSYIAGIFSYSLFTLPQITPVPLLLLIMILFAIEWAGRRQHYALAGIGCGWPPVYRLALYFCLTAIIIFFSGAEQQFIYFQF